MPDQSSSPATSTSAAAKPAPPRTTRLPRKAAAFAFAATLGLTGTAVAASAMTSSAASRPTANSAHSRILHLDVRFSPTNVIDVPPRQRHPGDYQPGDYVTFSDRLLNQSGMVVGTEGGSGLITKLTSTQIQLNYTMTVKLRGGQIAAAGLSTNAPTKRLAIVGGTRHYEGATGHLVLVENGDETGELTITLRR